MDYRGLHLVLQVPDFYSGEFASVWRLPGVDKLGFIDADLFVALATGAARGKYRIVLDGPTTRMINFRRRMD